MDKRRIPLHNTHAVRGRQIQVMLPSWLAHVLVSLALKVREISMFEENQTSPEWGKLMRYVVKACLPNKDKVYQEQRPCNQERFLKTEW